MEIKRKRVEIGPACIYYQQTGSGTPVILIHGLSGSGRWWARNIQFLARKYSVYVVDLIGFGKSKGRHKFVLDEASEYIVRWMNQLDLTRAHIVGHSMGGVIAIDLAATYPEKVDQLVLIDVAAFVFERPYIRSAFGIARAIPRLPLSFFPVLFYDALRAGPFTLLRAARELLVTDVSVWVNRVEAPVLIIWGENDTIIPVSVGKRLYKMLHDSRLSIVPDSGHNPMWDQSHYFNEMLTEFLHHAEAAVPQDA